MPLATPMSSFPKHNFFESNDPDIDRTWVDRMRGGDAEAFEIVFRALVRPLIGYVFRFVDSRPIAEEIVQDLFLSVWQRRATLELTGGSITAYLFSAAHHRALAHVRRERVASRWRDREEIIVQGQQESGVVVRDDVEDAVLAMAVQRAVDLLPARCREVFRLSRRDGLSYAEISARLGISKKTVENHMRLALKSLRARLKRHFP